MRGFFVCRWDNFSSDSSFDSGLGSDSDARFDADVPAPEVLATIFLGSIAGPDYACLVRVFPPDDSCRAALFG